MKKRWSTRKLNLVGDRYGMLVVIKESAENLPCQPRKWVCKCDCGKSTLRVGDHMRRGFTRSCGCSSGALIAFANTTHGMTKTKTYNSWHAMISRCTYPGYKVFHHYGGRGIKVCERWKTFANFLEDMGTRPKGKTLDRIDVDGHYEKPNCRWATVSEQLRNRRSASKSQLSAR